MTPRDDDGFLAVIETLAGEQSTSRYADHLASNIAAAMAIGDLPGAPVRVARPGTGTDLETGTLLIDPGHPVAARAALAAELADGTILVCDRYLQALRARLGERAAEYTLGQGLELAVPRPDALVFLDGGPDGLDPAAAHLRAQILALAATPGSIVSVVDVRACVAHQDACDAVWRLAAGALGAWTARHTRPHQMLPRTRQVLVDLASGLPIGALAAVDVIGQALAADGAAPEVTADALAAADGAAASGIPADGVALAVKATLDCRLA